MATSRPSERYVASGGCQAVRRGGLAPLPGGARLRVGGARQDVGRRGVKEYRAPEALALIAADREHTPLVCPSCGTRSIQRVPRRRGARGGVVIVSRSERITLTCQSCGRHASYIERGPEPPRDSTMDPHPAPPPH